MYQGLYNTRRGLSPGDFARVGALNALLMLQWNQWVHRRVELTRILDAGLAHRDVSVDFTLPHWFHDVRGTPDEGAARQLVPVALVRKGVLVNFDLRDERGWVLPLLTTAQRNVVAEASLVALAERVLGHQVPRGIRCDIRQLVSEPSQQAAGTLIQLYHRADPEAPDRARLAKNDVFRATARSFVGQALALTMIELKRHQRRIVSFGYDESVWGESTKSLLQRAVGTAGLALGVGRRVIFPIPSLGYAASYHFEAEAPEGLQIQARAQFRRLPSKLGDEGPRAWMLRGGSFQRSHTVFAEAPPGSEAAVVVRLQPRPSTIVRGAFGAALFTFAALLFLRLRLPSIRSGSDTTTAAALLLVFPGLASLYISRTDESAATNDLLWPVRLLALTPIVWALIGAGAIIGGTTGSGTRVVLWTLVGLAFVSCVMLANLWRVVSARNDPTVVD